MPFHSNVRQPRDVSLRSRACCLQSLVSPYLRLRRRLAAPGNRPGGVDVHVNVMYGVWPGSEAAGWSEGGERESTSLDPCPKRIPAPKTLQVDLAACTLGCLSLKPDYLARTPPGENSTPLSLKPTLLPLHVMEDGDSV